MKRIAMCAVLLLSYATPFLMAQRPSPATSGHGHFEAGIFAEYFRLSQVDPHLNLVGLGGRAGFNLKRNVQLEAEMSYDFKRNFTSVFSNGATTQLVNTRLRTLHALIGPKFETSSGAVRAFATFKTGLVNFSVSDQNALPGFTSALGSVTSGNTNAAIYPGGGFEAFLGPVGLRFEAGDEIYFDHGAHNNLKLSFGPHIRF